MNKVALFLNRFWTCWILVHGAFVAGISVFEIPLILSNFLLFSTTHKGEGRPSSRSASGTLAMGSPRKIRRENLKDLTDLIDFLIQLDTEARTQ